MISQRIIRNRNALLEVSVMLSLLLVACSGFQVTLPPTFGVVQRNRNFVPISESSSAAGSTSLFYAKNTDNSMSQASPSESIEDRVREMLTSDAKVIRKELESETETRIERPSTLAPLPNMYTVQTVQDYNKILGDADGKLTVVRFTASFCLACKAVSPLFNRLARESPNVTFVNVVVTKENRQDIHDLGVPSLPYGFVFHPDAEGMVERVSINKRFFNDFQTIVQSYDDRECQLGELNEETGIYESPYARNH